ncbi:MAG: AAA family ATPase [Candidatus Woesearchaeota archaeon]
MANLFKNMLSAEESLFINPEALDYDYLPKLLPFREDQQFYLANCIKPLFSKRNTSNVLITGAPGIGKTAACKFVLRDLEMETNRIVPLYVNCWKKDTAHKVVLEICNQLGYHWIQNKKTHELFKEIAEQLNKKSAVIILDEIDKLEDEQVIYQLIEDIYRKCLILITNDKEWISTLDKRVYSRLLPKSLEFSPYNAKETEGILKQRLEYAFVPDIWDEEAFNLIVDKAVEAKDIRTGLFLLREAGNMAENKSSRKILNEHAQAAIERLSTFKIRNSKDLTEEENDLLSLIRTHPNLTSTEIYDRYKNTYNKTYRTFHRKLKGLEESGLITISEDNTEKGGKISRLKVEGENPK